ncbi:hypothetical protein [Anatilimnocola floriformis]|uniref:hypothetical protein n=1 Tax=Anatilimnocola floriformis TaxID=2948575 RepID=UPI0020C4872C|nr:hypothetical protein [Anatilimnocola floriformis]
MKRTIIKAASLGLLLGALALPARADWLNYIVRTSGLAWSDGYHAYDQCPPKQKPFHQYSVMPGTTTYGNSHAPAHEPYYFELNNKQQEQEAIPTPAGMLPAAPQTTAPNPQAQYKPRSRYFQALEQNTQQPLQARQPATTRPY